MDINITLLGETITFALLVWVTMKYIWPPIIRAMQERQQKIASGLEAAERGQHSLELAQKNIAEQLRAAKEQANDILEKTNRQATALLEETRNKAQAEHQKIVETAKSDIEKETTKAKAAITQHVGALIIEALEKLLPEKIDTTTQNKLVENFIKDLS